MKVGRRGRHFVGRLQECCQHPLQQFLLRGSPTKICNPSVYFSTDVIKEQKVCMSAKVGQICMNLRHVLVMSLCNSPKARSQKTVKKALFSQRVNGAEKDKGSISTQTDIVSLCTSNPAASVVGSFMTSTRHCLPDPYPTTPSYSKRALPPAATPSKYLLCRAAW